MDNGKSFDGDVKMILKILMEHLGIAAKELSIRSSLSTRKISRIVKTLRESGKNWFRPQGILENQ